MPLLNYKISCQATANQTNQTLVLIHGLFGSMDNLNMVARTLSQYFQVVSVDVRNHGSSFHQNSMSYDEMAQDVILLLDHLKIKQAHFLGHSMGGKIAMQIALNHSDYVNKLVVADIAPVAYPPHHTQIMQGLQAIDLANVEKRSDADKQLAPYVPEQGVRQFLLRNLVIAKQADGSSKASFKCALDYIVNCYSQIMVGYQGEQQFSGAVLFIKGANSNYLTSEQQPVIHQLFPNASAKIIADTGHWLHAEKSQVFNQIALHFLQD